MTDRMFKQEVDRARFAARKHLADLERDRGEEIAPAVSKEIIDAFEIGHMLGYADAMLDAAAELREEGLPVELLLEEGRKP